MRHVYRVLTIGVWLIGMSTLAAAQPADVPRPEAAPPQAVATPAAPLPQATPPTAKPTPGAAAPTEAAPKPEPIPQLADAVPTPPSAKPITLVISGDSAIVTYHCTAPKGIKAVIEIGPQNTVRKYPLDQPGAKDRFVLGQDADESSKLEVWHDEADLDARVEVPLDRLTGSLRYHINEAVTTTKTVQTGSVKAKNQRVSPPAIRAILMLRNLTGAPWVADTPVEVRCDNLTAVFNRIDLAELGTELGLVLHETQLIDTPKQKLANAFGYWVTDEEFKDGKGNAIVRLLGTAWPKALSIPRPIQVAWNGKPTVIELSGTTPAERAENFRKFTTAPFLELALTGVPSVEVALSRTYSGFARQNRSEDPGVYQWTVQQQDLLQRSASEIKQPVYVSYKEPKSVVEVPNSSDEVAGAVRTIGDKIPLRIEMGAANAEDVRKTVVTIADIRKRFAKDSMEDPELAAIGLPLMVIYSDLRWIEDTQKDLISQIRTGDDGGLRRKRVDDLGNYATSLIDTWNRRLALQAPLYGLKEWSLNANDMGLD